MILTDVIAISGLALRSDQDPRHIVAGEDTCVWYGQCDKSDESHILNCFYNGPPKPFDPSAIDTLKENCPELVDASGKALTCCDLDQVNSFAASVAIAKTLLARCPSCWHNFRNYLCTMTCGTQQSRYLYAQKTKKGDKEHKDQKAIVELEYLVSEQYTESFFDSCKDVSNPLMGNKALDMLCGPWGAALCTGDRWLTYMGDVSNGFAPFLVNVTYWKEKTVNEHGKTFYPQNYPIAKCSQQIDNQSACSCVDCEESCPVPPPYPPEPQQFKIFGYDGVLEISVLVFVAFSLPFIVISFFVFKRMEKNRARIADKADTTTVTSELPINNVDEMVGCYTRFGAAFESSIHRFFTSWGKFCATHTFLVLFCGLAVAAALTSGVIYFKVITDPIELWAMPTSRARVERKYFDKHFEPFYRTEQLIITPTDDSKFIPPGKDTSYGPVFRLNFLLQILDLQLKIEGLTAEWDNETVTLKDICFAPLSPDNNECTVQSVPNYFQNNQTLMEKPNYLDVLRDCFRNPTSPTCLGTYGGPVFPYVALGGFEGKDYFNATAMVLTFLNNNYYNSSQKLGKAMAWEKVYVQFMKDYKNPNMTIAFTSEAYELDRESKSDVSTILISYLIMFAYISIALGQANHFNRLLIDSKITLGISGVLIVLLSVGASIGFFGYVGLAGTLIIIEVIPFLVLAVGVDNIFILVQTFQRDQRQPTESREEQIGRIVGEVAPSMFLSSFSESCCFFLGGLSAMPAVKTFALYAGLALFIDFVLQITCFVSLLSMDIRRQENNRLDICCCIKSSKTDASDHSESLLFKIFKNVYAPFLLKPAVRVGVIVIFFGWLCSSAAVISKIEIGLDQELSMPEDSFVLNYFESLKKYLAVGPPVYFVVEGGYNYSWYNAQDQLCSGLGCGVDSLLMEIRFAAKQSKKTYIAQESQSWLDSYEAWGTEGDCCWQKTPTGGGYCPEKKSPPCYACNIQTELHNNATRIRSDNFEKYLPIYLEENPPKDADAKCIGGHAAFASGVELLDDKTEIGATYFMTYHTILKSSKDYFSALKWARYLAERITTTINKNLDKGNDTKTYSVFPYSVFYVFYEQYLTMWEDTLQNLAISIGAIFIVSFVLLGFDIFSALIIIATISMIIMNLMGLMYWWHIQLNAVSLVNLVMAVGIAVEFCSHITRAYAVSVQDSRLLRTKESIVNMGSSVLSGITLTKFGGIIVLAFAKSQIFRTGAAAQGAMEAGGATAVNANFDDFLQTGRTGRRNAMPHIMTEGAAVGTGDLPCEMGKLSCSDSSSGTGEASGSTQTGSMPANGEAETPQA
uniref:SSD domain-containing protein n=1 Tax=Strigamia maritima TaxID=126957 RepID=T1IQG2_STRMM